MLVLIGIASSKKKEIHPKINFRNIHLPLYSINEYERQVQKKKRKKRGAKKREGIKSERN